MVNNWAASWGAAASACHGFRSNAEPRIQTDACLGRATDFTDIADGNLSHAFMPSDLQMPFVKAMSCRVRCTYSGRLLICGFSVRFRGGSPAFAHECRPCAKAGHAPQARHAFGRRKTSLLTLPGAETLPIAGPEGLAIPRLVVRPRAHPRLVPRIRLAPVRAAPRGPIPDSARDPRGPLHGPRSGHDRGRPDRPGSASLPVTGRRIPRASAVRRDSYPGDRRCRATNATRRARSFRYD